MNKRSKTSWERILYPKTLRANLIAVSIFSMAFEMLTSNTIKRLQDFYSFNESQYEKEVLSLNSKRSPIYASLAWLLNVNAIEAKDLETFEYLKRCRNTVVHETLKVASEGADFDLGDELLQIIELARKIDLWWIVNVDASLEPDRSSMKLIPSDIVTSTEWSIRLLVDVALGSEEQARRYYDSFKSNSEDS